MVLAASPAGWAIQWISPDTVSRYLGDNATGIAVAATIGILINVPLMFEIPLVAALLLVGMGTAPAAVLLFAAAAGGPITFWGLAKALPIRATATFVGATWMLGVLGGVAILFIDQWTDSEAGLRSPALAARHERVGAGDAFTDVAAVALNGGYVIWNDRPGVAMFDYDRDGDLDFYVTSQENNLTGSIATTAEAIFDEVAESAGVTALDSHSTGAVACDLDNDGFQDLYVGACGRIPRTFSTSGLQAMGRGTGTCYSTTTVTGPSPTSPTRPSGRVSTSDRPRPSRVETSTGTAARPVRR